MLVTVITISLASKASTWRNLLHLAMFEGIQRLVGHRLNGFRVGEQVVHDGAHINAGGASVGSRATISSSFPVTSASVANARAVSPCRQSAASADLVSDKGRELPHRGLVYVCLPPASPFLSEPQAVPP